MNAAIPAVIIGGVVYVAATNKDAASTGGATKYQVPSYGSTLGDIAGGMTTGGGGYYGVGLGDGGQAAFNVGGRNVDPDAQSKIDLLNQGLQKAYNGMSMAAKATAADNLNQTLALNPPLRGNETWETVARVAGGATAGVACNAIPGVGTAVSPLCAMAGAYLGVKLEQWMSTALPDLGNWITDNVGSVVNNIGDTLSDLWNSVF